MIKSLLLIPMAICCLTLPSSGQTTCFQSFAKTIGSALSSESGYSLAADYANKIIYIGGSINDSTMLLKVNADGDLLWTRTFDAIAGQNERIAAVLLDSDGKLLIAGLTENTVGGTAFLVKYDIQLDQIIWANEYRAPSNNYVFSLIEKGAGGNYLMSNNPLDPNDAELLEIDRNTGQINVNFSKHYSFGSSQTFWDLVLYQGALYSTGRFTEGSGLSHMRNVLIKMDPDNGTPIWTKLGHRPSNVSARFYGTDLVIDQGEIFSTSYGNPGGTDLSVSKMYIHKTSLDGTVLWTKQYEIPASEDVSQEIISTGDGFVIMGKTTGPNSLFLFKINRDGDVLWGYSFDFPGNENTFTLGGAVTQLISLDGAFYFTGWTEVSGRRDMILIKTNSEGRMDDGCTTAKPIDIAVTTVANATYYSVEPEVFTLVPEVIALNLPLANTSLQTKNTCIVSGNIEHTVEASICSGDSYEGYHQAGSYRDTFAVAGGCDSVRILNLRLITCDPLVVYNLNACSSYMTDGSNMDYSEFVPAYPASDACASVTASTLHRSPPQENKHSCTPGLNNSSAMCVSSLDGCTWIPGHQASVVMEVTVTPEANAISEITGLKFYEKAPTTYNWIDGGNGPNNYPTLFGIRILKDGTVIYSDPAIPTATGWTLHEISFIGNSLFEINQATVFRIELLPYCPVGNGAAVAAWDLEDVVLSGGCVILPASDASLAGHVVNVKGNPMSGAEVHLSRYGSFSIYEADETSIDGAYQFEGLEAGAAYHARGYYLDDFLHGVSTLDLITMQKHLLGKVPFSSLDQYVAADINHDGEVNISDLIMLRRTLLGYTNDFPGNTSWRFGVLPQSMEGTDPARFDELLYIETIQSGETNADFIGIKVGDLNKTITGRASDEPIAKRTDDAISISVEDMKMGPGSIFTMTIKANEDIITDGLQLGWQFDGMTLADIQGVVLPVTEDNISFQHDGVFRLSWNGNAPVSIHKGDVLFTLTLTPSIAESLSGNIRQADEVLVNEIYTDQKATPVRLDIISTPSVDVPIIGFMSVTPNPFTDETVVSYTIAKDGLVRINMFDVSGRLLYTTSREETSGEHAVRISAGDLGHYAGMLICQIVCDGAVKVRKVVRSE